MLLGQDPILCTVVTQNLTPGLKEVRVNGGIFKVSLTNVAPGPYDFVMIWNEGGTFYLWPPDSEGEGYVTASYGIQPGEGGPDVKAGKVQDIVNVKTTDQIVNLVIHNGQSGNAVADEEGLGAFTVANLNNTDGDNSVDKNDTNGVVEGGTGKGRDEVDLMELVIKKPMPVAGGNVTLDVTGAVVLWEEETKQTKIALPMGQQNYTFAVNTLPKTVWVELTAVSTTVRDVKLELSYNGKTDTVKATGVWAEKTAFRTSQEVTQLTGAAMNKNAGSNQITVKAALSGWVTKGTHIILFDEPYGYFRKGFTVTKRVGNVLTLDNPIGAVWDTGTEVREGHSINVDNPLVLELFIIRGGRLGDTQISPVTCNAMEMEFTLKPPGIGLETTVVWDITRQKEYDTWYNNPTPTGGTGLGHTTVDSWPTKEEEPNDDGYDKDEDNTPIKVISPTTGKFVSTDKIYSRDMPGTPTADADEATKLGTVLRWNFKEFVRVKFGGGAIKSANGTTTGSRCSDKIPWRSRINVKGTITTPPTRWTRNGGGNENEIIEGNKKLTVPPPKP